MCPNLAIKYDTFNHVNIELLQSVYKFFPKEEMPFLNKAIRYCKKHQPYLGLNIVQNLHLTEATICKIIPLLYSGASLTLTATKELQVKKHVLELIKRANVNFVPPEELPNNFDIALDCGGGLVDFIIPKIGTAELTQSGKAKYKNAKLNYPTISVDESNLKILETFYGTGEGFTNALCEITKEDIRNKKFVVFGYGKVGRGLIHALEKFTNNIIVVEYQEEQIKKAKKNGYKTLSILENEAVKNEIKTAFCVVTATGENKVISKFFTQDDFEPCKYLANMGTEDEFGDNFNNERVLCNKSPINFSIDVPTSIKYLDPIFYAHNLVIELLLTKKFSKGFYKFPLKQDMIIIGDWERYYNTTMHYAQ